MLFGQGHGVDGNSAVFSRAQAWAFRYGMVFLTGCCKGDLDVSEAQECVAGRSIKDPNEISVALALLLRYPETRDCLKKPQKDLQEALDIGDYRHA